MFSVFYFYTVNLKLWEYMNFENLKKHIHLVIVIMNNFDLFNFALSKKVSSLDHIDGIEKSSASRPRIHAASIYYISIIYFIK